MISSSIKLGLNVDHVATLRQQRKEGFPDPVELAAEAVKAGADGVTAHLREDRRHIQDEDIRRLRGLPAPLNLEMAVAAEIIGVAESVRPAWACLVPERRQELTTEGGLDVDAGADAVRRAIERLHRAGVKVSLFVEPRAEAVSAAKALGAEAVELHTGAYARAHRSGDKARTAAELDRIGAAAKKAAEAGLVVNAGHGLSYENVEEVAARHPFHEFNIGFAIIGRSLLVGITEAVREMKQRLRRTTCVES